MNEERERRALEISERLVDQDSSRRSEDLDRECGDDGELRRRVEDLLTAESPAEFLQPLGFATLAEIVDETRLVFGPGDTLDKFVIERLIGSGGMSQVYLAKDSRLERHVAIKILSPHLNGPTWRRRLAIESRAISALKHPNVCTLYDVGREDSVEFLVMEYVEGETLAERLARKTPVPLDEIVRIALELTRALGAAHEIGIVHRDLKPSNIVLSDSGVKVLDFGVAKFNSPPTLRDAQGSAAADIASRSGLILGTVSYMSPEQARGQRIDQRTDIWSFGCVLFELLARKRAFDGKTDGDCLVACLEREPDWEALPSTTPPRIRLLVERCLRKDAELRLHHMADARLELEDSTDAEAVAERLSARPLTTWRRLLPWIITSVALALCVIQLFVPRVRSPSDGSERRELSIILPEDSPIVDERSLPLSIGRPSIAMSPDGSKIVYVAARFPSAGRHLCLRSLDAFDVIPIEGTEEACGPFFSPDGVRVAFFARERLHTVSLQGGRPTTLCDAPNPYGGTWSADGTIVFATDFGSHLRRVSENGGTVEDVAPRRGELMGGLRGNFHWPQFLRNRKAVLVGTGPLDHRLEVVSLVGGEILSRIDEPGTGPLLAGSSHLLFGRSGDVYALPFDFTSLKPTGRAFPFVEGVRTSSLATGASHQTSVAADGTIAYVPGPTLDLGTLVWVETSGEIVSAVEGQRVYGALQLSPDGDRVAATVHDLKLEVWIFDLSGEARPRRISGREPSWAPVWDSKGTRVIYTAMLGGRLTLLSCPVDGVGDREDLLGDWDDGFLNKPRDVSPDGEWLLFDAAKATDRGLDVWAYRFADRTIHPILVSDESESVPTFSNDGTSIAYTAGDEKGYRVFVCPFPGGDPKVQVSSGRGEEPVWSGDDSRIYYRDGNEWFAGTRSGDAGTKLFRGPYLNVPGVSYDYDASEDRFLVIQGIAHDRPQREIRVISNGLRLLSAK